MRVPTTGARRRLTAIDLDADAVLDADADIDTDADIDATAVLEERTVWQRPIGSPVGRFPKPSERLVTTRNP